MRSESMTVTVLRPSAPKISAKHCVASNKIDPSYMICGRIFPALFHDTPEGIVFAVTSIMLSFGHLRPQLLGLIVQFLIGSHGIIIFPCESPNATSFVRRMGTRAIFKLPTPTCPQWLRPDAKRPPSAVRMHVNPVPRDTVIAMDASTYFLQPS